MAYQLVSRGQQHSKDDELLLYYSTKITNRYQRKNRVVDSQQQNPTSGYSFLSGAKLCLEQSKFTKAYETLQRALLIDPNLGDIWIYMYGYELKYGTKESQQDFLSKFYTNIPTRGILWNSESNKNIININVLKELDIKPNQLSDKIIISAKDILYKCIKKIDILHPFDTPSVPY